jgi:hypothetical protein
MDNIDSKNLSEQLSDLFRATAEAHHRAYLATDGLDPDWPLWYADALLEPLQHLLKVDLTRAGIADLLVQAEREQRSKAPAGDWPAFYASYFIDRYSGEK